MKKKQTDIYLLSTAILLDVVEDFSRNTTWYNNTARWVFVTMYVIILVGLTYNNFKKDKNEGSRIDAQL